VLEACLSAELRAAITGVIFTGDTFPSAAQLDTGLLEVMAACCAIDVLMTKNNNIGGYWSPPHRDSSSIDVLPDWVMTSKCITAVRVADYRLVGNAVVGGGSGGGNSSEDYTALAQISTMADRTVRAGDQRR
jgi:hypothetical protein